MLEKFKELAGLQDLERKHLYLLLAVGSLSVFAVIGFGVKYFSGDFAQERAEESWGESVNEMCKCRDLKCFTNERISLHANLSRDEAVKTPDIIDDRERAIGCLNDLCLEPLRRKFRNYAEGDDISDLADLNYKCITNLKNLEVLDGHSNIEMKGLLKLKSVPYPGVD